MSKKTPMPPRKKKPSFDVTGPAAAAPVASTSVGWVKKSSPEDDPAKADDGLARAGHHEDAGRHVQLDTARDAEAFNVVRRYALFAAGAGLLPVPLADMTAIAAIQLMMVAELAKVYKVPFEKDLVRPIVGSLIGGYTSTKLGYRASGVILKTIPAIGPFLGALAVPAFGAGATWAIGRVFIQHFASGGTFLNFEPAQVRTFYARAHEPV